MSRRFLIAGVFAAWAFVAPRAWAEPVSFSFTAVPLMDFAQATYRNVLGRDFVIASDLLGLGKKVTVSVKSIESSQVAGFLENVLRSHGVRAVDRGGVYFLELAPVERVAAELEQDKPVPDQVSGPSVPGVEEPQIAAIPKVELVTVKNRPASFVVDAVNAVFGTPYARLAGGARLALVVPEDRFDQVRDLVDQLDVAAASVEVSASFVEVTRSGSSARGLSLVADTVASRLDGVSVLPGEGRVSIRAGRYEMVLDALASDGRFRQVSNSRVVGDDAEKLLLSVGDETPTISSTSRDQAGNAVQNVVYRPSGVILDVVPRVLGSGRVSLAVDGQVSSFQSTTTGVSGSPTLVKRQIKTAVSLDDGQVLVIGGLDDSKSSGSEAGFSFLPDSWRNKSATDTKTDLVLILSARVLPGEPQGLIK